MTDDPIVVRSLDHFYGEGELRRQILFGVSVEMHAGEIVILTGPSGSGKTTLLTLIGALRSAQAGSVRVLGRELRGASEATLVGVRQRTGYVFQQHNLLESLSAQQNVQMALQLDAGLSGSEIEKRALDSLDAVGLVQRAHAHPSELSGGERQRVAIARALARRPRIVLADEPTASLDRETGRAVVDILQQLARRDGITVVLVTHDSRILDVADRILAMEDGRLSSLLGWVGSDGRRMLRLLVEETGRGELVERVRRLDEREFLTLVESIANESRGLLELADVVQSEAFDGVRGQFVEALECWLRERLHAGGARLTFASDDGIAARDAVTELARTGSSARARIALPLVDSHGATFALLEISDPAGAEAFDSGQRELMERIVGALGSVLESWWRMSCRCRAGRVAAGELAPAQGTCDSKKPARF